MAGIQRETIDKSKIEGKKIVWIMGRLILELIMNIILHYLCIDESTVITF